ncbi:MAG TPA: hypothetical protein VH640_27170 [Bryobacteraceae bacterium]|jgi:hypothetical protein
MAIKTRIMLLMFEITRVPADAPEVTETLGTKDKFWYGNQRFLFKMARDGTGEDWAEKIVAELARQLGVPHAEYSLADWDLPAGSVRGVVSPNFCPPGAALTLGNELLSEANPACAVGQISKFRVQAHTVERVLFTLENLNPRLPLGWIGTPMISDSVDVFVGYLMLDALVGNTDRHHENWGVVCLPDRTVHLAPTFDHASSLGCHLLDENRAQRLRTTDRNFGVPAFAAKARSAFYRYETDPKPLLTTEAFLDAAAYRPSAARDWLGRLNALTELGVAIIVNNVPHDRISDTGIEFAQSLILINQNRLIEAGRNLR